MKEKEREKQEKIIAEVLAVRRPRSHFSSKVATKISTKEILDYVIEDVKEKYKNKQDTKRRQSQPSQGWLMSPMNES